FQSYYPPLLPATNHHSLVDPQTPDLNHSVQLNTFFFLVSSFYKNLEFSKKAPFYSPLTTCCCTSSMFVHNRLFKLNLEIYNVSIFITKNKPHLYFLIDSLLSIYLFINLYQLN